MKRINGIYQIMFYEDDLDVNEFNNLTAESILKLFNELIQNNSEYVFCLENLDNISVEERCIKVNSIEDKFQKLYNYKLYIYEKLEYSNITIDVLSLDRLPDQLEIKSMNKHIFEDRDMLSFIDYKFLEDGNEIDLFIEGESYGVSVSKQLYILGENGTLYNIDLLNDDIEEELDAIKEMIC
jgi:hypothetical protein